MTTDLGPERRVQLFLACARAVYEERACFTEAGARYLGTGFRLPTMAESERHDSAARLLARSSTWWLRGSLALLLSLLLVGPVLAGGLHGTASHYGPGNGVATQWCTWTLRHTEGCGRLRIQSDQTGLTVTVPVVDWCQCYRGTARERIVDLEYGVVAALGLELADGLYPVTTWRVGSSSSNVPDTAMEADHD